MGRTTRPVRLAGGLFSPADADPDESVLLWLSELVLQAATPVIAAAAPAAPVALKRSRRFNGMTHASKHRFARRLFYACAYS